LAGVLIDELVHRDVDTAHEKAGDACDLAGITTLGHEMLEARQIGLDNFLVDLLREQQRDIDVDSLADEAANRRQTGLCARHLDHQVVAADRLPEASRLGVHRQVGRHFEADISVTALHRLIDRAQRVRRTLDHASPNATCLTNSPTEPPVCYLRTPEHGLKNTLNRRARPPCRSANR
jgi:hypothetical protein